MSPQPQSHTAGLTKHPALWMVTWPVVAFLIAISSVRHDPTPPFLTGDHSPYGYTMSLALFFIPTAGSLLWFKRRRAQMPHQWRAFWMTMLIVATTWSLLDITLGNSFFNFPNKGAVLGIYAPGYTFGKGWEWTIPIEEFAFYILGSSSILLGYLWAAESWLSKYSLSSEEYAAEITRLPKLVQFERKPVIIGVGVFAAALIWKKFGWHEHTAGFPAYFLFELVMVVLPASMLLRAVSSIINTPAFVYKTLVLVLTSVLWEATLALPYGWWGFNHQYMMGLMIRPWYNLPIEEVILWPCAAWLNLTLYETIRMCLTSGRPMREVLFGPRTQTVAGVVLLLALGAGTANAQVSSGAVYGTVVANDQPLAGATITVTGSAAPHTMTTDGRGEFRALNLSPGTYRVEITATGYWPSVYESIAVGIGQDLTVDATLLPATAEVQVTVSPPPLIERRQVRSGATLDQAELERLPTSRDVWEVARLTPGVMVDRVNIAGADSTEPSAISAPGYAMTQQGWSIDGIVITDSTTPGIAAAFFDFDSLQEVQVTTGGSDVGVATGGSINLVTRRGTNRWSGSARILSTTGGLQSGLNLPSNALAAAGPWNLNTAQRAIEQGNRIDLSRDVGVEVGGPLRRDRAWVWAAFGHQDIDLFTIGEFREQTTFNTVSAKVDGISRGTQWEGLFIRDRRLKSGRNVGPLRPPETAWDFPVTTSISKIELARVISGRHFISGNVSYVQEDLAAQALGGRDVNAVLEPSGIWRGSFVYGHERRPQLGFKLDARSFLATRGASHELRLGMDRRTSWNETFSGWPGPGGVIGLATAIHTIGIPLATATVGSSNEDDRTITAFFAQDTIAAGRWTANIGLRVDVQGGSNRASSLPANSLFSTLLPGLTFAGRHDVIGWTTVTPKLGLVYALDEARTTLVKASVRQFPDELSFTDIQHSNPTRYQPGGIIGVTQSVTFLWLDGGDYRFSPSEIGPVVAISGVDPTRPGFFPSRIDPDYRSPITDEAIVGVDRELGHSLVASTDVTWRRTRHIRQIERLVYDDAAGARADAGRVHTTADYVVATRLTGQLPDGASYSVPVYRLRPGVTWLGGGLLTNGDRRQHSLGWTASLRRRFANDWMARGWVSVNRWTWDVPDGEAADPTPRLGGEFEDGSIVVQDTASLGGVKTSAFLNGQWSFSMSGLYRVAASRPWTFDVSGDLYGRQGYPIPYARTVTGVETGDGIDRMVRVSPTVGSARNDAVVNLNARVERTFRVRGGSTLALGLDAFNLLNRSSVLQRQHELNLPVGDHVIEVVSPRALRLGARVRW